MMVNKLPTRNVMFLPQMKHPLLCTHLHRDDNTTDNLRFINSGDYKSLVSNEIIKSSNTKKNKNCPPNYFIRLCHNECHLIHL